MATIKAGGGEVGRWVTERGTGVLLRRDGRLLRRVGDRWVRWRRLKEGVSVEEYFQKVVEGRSKFGKVFMGVTPPSFSTLRKWALDDGVCEAIDGCRVEVDGKCPHGYESWLIVRGMI